MPWHPKPMETTIINRFDMERVSRLKTIPLKAKITLPS